MRGNDDVGDFAATFGPEGIGSFLDMLDCVVFRKLPPFTVMDTADIRNPLMGVLTVTLIDTLYLDTGRHRIALLAQHVVSKLFLTDMPWCP